MKGHFEGDIFVDMAKNIFEVRNFKYGFEGSEKETQMAYDFTEKSLKQLEKFTPRARETHSIYPSDKIENGEGLIVIDDGEKVEKVLQVVDDVHDAKEKLDKLIEEANKKIKDHFDDSAYKKMVYKLKSNEILYYRISRIFSERKFIDEVAKCVEESKLTRKMKKAIRLFMSMFMNCPEFIFINLGRIYEDSIDEKNDKLWGYLKMICKYFFKNVDNSVGCIEMGQMIYGLMLDAIGEASAVYEDYER